MSLWIKFIQARTAAGSSYGKDKFHVFLVRIKITLIPPGPPNRGNYFSPNSITIAMNAASNQAIWTVCLHLSRCYFIMHLLRENLSLHCNMFKSITLSGKKIGFIWINTHQTLAVFLNFTKQATGIHVFSMKQTAAIQEYNPFTKFVLEVQKGYVDYKRSKNIASIHCFHFIWLNIYA